jgi:peptidyl-prolyl cis-trans isomerase D
VKNEVPFVDVPYPVARAVQKKYTFNINEAGLDKVIEQAKGVRAKSDSSKVGAPGAAAPGAAPAPAAPAPDTTKK